MKYEGTVKLSNQAFRHPTGAKRTTFAKMVEILSVSEAEKRRTGGHKSKLPIEGKLLLSLEHLREYRTYFHIAQDFVINETSALRISRWVEDVLIKDGTFSLPGRKAMLKNGADFEVVLVDATESPIERPKKTAPALLRQEKAARFENTGHSQQSGRQGSLPCVCQRETGRFASFQGIRRTREIGNRT
jgi:hypothetical protein